MWLWLFSTSSHTITTHSTVQSADKAAKHSEAIAGHVYTLERVRPPGAASRSNSITDAPPATSNIVKVMKLPTDLVPKQLDDALVCALHTSP